MCKEHWQDTMSEDLWLGVLVDQQQSGTHEGSSPIPADQLDGVLSRTNNGCRQFIARNPTNDAWQTMA